MLTIESMNESVKNVEYAVRGELAIKAENLRVVTTTPCITMSPNVA